VIWRPIPSHPSHEASDGGKIRRIGARTLSRQHLTPNGYLYARLGNASVTVNRAVCEAFHGPAPTEAHQAAHNNGVRADNRASNLRWATRKQNYQDQIAHGTSKRGTGHHLAKLSAEEVRQIRQRHASGEKQLVLAREYRVRDSAISRIVNGKRWSRL
jgi:hypothetical protein